MLGQRDGGGDQPFQRGKGAGVQLFSGQSGRQAARVGDQAPHQALAERVVGGSSEKIVMRKPGGESRPNDVRTMRQRVRRRRRDPFADQGAGAQSRGVGAQRAQIAQPGEAMGGGVQHRRTAASPHAPGRSARTPPPNSSSP